MLSNNCFIIYLIIHIFNIYIRSTYVLHAVIKNNQCDLWECTDLYRSRQLITTKLRRQLLGREQFGLPREDKEGFMEKQTFELDQRFLNVVFAPQVPFGNVCRHFWLSKLAKRRIAICIKWVETRDHHTITQQQPPNKGLSPWQLQLCQGKKPWNRS